MTPIHFPEANKSLLPPQGMTEKECGTLWVYTDGNQCVSCWKLTWRQRLAALFHGRIWLSVLSGYTQPPVWLDCRKTVFEHREEGAKLEMVLCEYSWHNTGKCDGCALDGSEACPKEVKRKK